MRVRLTQFARSVIVAVAYSAVGAAVVLLVVFVVYMNGRPDLGVWHTADLDAEFTADSGIDSFTAYLALEQRLFEQLGELVYAKIPAPKRTQINRYHRGSLSDPQRWERNWNRSFELPSDSPGATVLLLHGMSDSPYSLRHIAEELHAAGAHVLGLRLPGHGTAPSGLVEVTWQDMVAATRLALTHLSGRHPGVPLYIVGYSTGAALAVHSALDMLEDADRPRIDGLVLISPAIGVSRVAAFAVWQARLGHLLGLEKLAWNAILPEYDPFKYGSFAVNAGDVVYQLTNEIQARLSRLQTTGKLGNLPRILAFSSVVDATVSASALIDGLFDRLPDAGHELLLFDINWMAEMEPLMKGDPGADFAALTAGRERSFTLDFVTNRERRSREVAVLSWRPDDQEPTVSLPGLSWPDVLYSLSHVALPFPPDDPLYGGSQAGESPGITIGDIALRGERGVLQISAAEMLRLRWNPFYPYLQQRVLEFVGLPDDRQGAGK